VEQRASAIKQTPLNDHTFATHTRQRNIALAKTGENKLQKFK